MDDGGSEPKSIHAQLRHALEHLYDADALAEHELIIQLNLPRESARTGALRRSLIAAIERVRPDAQESPETPRWQMYQVLFQRYVQGTQVESLADQLGMSSRHLRRMQNRAIAYLAETLFQESTSLQESAMFPESAKPPQQAEPPSSIDHPNAREVVDFGELVKAVDEEIAWLRDAILSEPVSVKEVWEEALQFLSPLATSRGFEIDWSVPSYLPNVAIHLTGLRQVMLSILNYLVEERSATLPSVELSGIQTIQVTASASVEQVHITMSTVGQESAPMPSTPPTVIPSGLLLAQRILSIFGGRLLEHHKTDGRYEVLVNLMTAGGTGVLVIDDNPDILQLYQRYVTGTRYQLWVCAEPEQALAMAASHNPKAIVLDIMMPGLDGWSLLGKLRHHPVTAQIPVIISTIVSEQGLALALGADEFLKKPVTRLRFLSALDRLLMPPTLEGR